MDLSSVVVRRALTPQGRVPRGQGTLRAHGAECPGRGHGVMTVSLGFCPSVQVGDLRLSISV